VGFAPSEEVLQMVEDLYGRAEALQRTQFERGVAFAVGLEAPAQRLEPPSAHFHEQASVHGLQRRSTDLSTPI